jgi:hypothetical protein
MPQPGAEGTAKGGGVTLETDGPDTLCRVCLDWFEDEYRTPGGTPAAEEVIGGLNSTTVSGP